ncbi:MAG: hypothetical protein QM594_05850 [Niabella sp.]
MQKLKILLYSIAMVLSSCTRDENIKYPLLFHNIDTTDKVSVKLKAINQANLPSPVYYFEYNDSGYITRAGYASGLAFYRVAYAEGRITEMGNMVTVKRDKLLYKYSSGHPDIISIADSNGFVYRTCYFIYISTGQLQKIDWRMRQPDGSFIKDLAMEFSYHPDGNLKERIHTYHIDNTQPGILTFTETFENYDDKINVDGFRLLHANNNEHLFLTPQLRLQKNNPQRVTRKSLGAGVSYIANYTYSYNANGRPLKKPGDILFPDSNERFESQTNYSYYD